MLVRLAAAARFAYTCIMRGALSTVALLLWVGCGDDGGLGTGRDAGTMDGGPTVRVDAGPGGDAGDDCVHTGRPLLDPEVFDPCPMCAGAHCVPTSLVPMDQRDQLGDCDETSKCVPDLFIVTGGNFLLETCRSVANAEGRCVSRCVPMVAAQASLLPQSTCAETELCAPCFDPTTGEETGSCGLACDPGPAEPPVTFDPCCGGIGSCVPADLVPEAFLDQLGMDTCGAGLLCAPSALVDPSARPATCRSAGGVEGRCAAECLPAVQEQLDFLPVDSCMPGERCAPCYDPTSGEETGICSVNGDMPVEPPRTFDPCCDGRGACVPSDLVPADRRDAVGEDTCPMGMGLLCVPNVLIEDPTYVFPSCTTEGFIGGGEPGACVPDCLVGFLEGLLLGMSTCAEGEKCAPCTDPLSGMPTGACG